MMPRKLLLIAPFASEHSTGEGASAFHLIASLARRFDVTLLTYRLVADPPADAGALGARVVEWTDLPLVGRFPGINSQLTPGYVPFFLRARRWLREHGAREGFDLVHQLAPLALRYPCAAVGLGIPFVVGPLAGTLDAPPALQDAVEREPLHRRLRRLDRLRFRFDPLLRATYSRARALIAVAPYVQELLRSLDLPTVRFMSEAGVTRTSPRLPRAGEGSGPARLLFVGRVIRTKGVREAIQALGAMEDRGATLDVVGGGEDLEACRRLAAEGGLNGRVRFHGHLPRRDVDEFYRTADLFVFPSFREPSGKAVVEALSHGVPVVAAAHGGPAAVVDDTCGRLVEPAPPSEFARRIANEIDALLARPSLLEALGRGALERIEARYTWDRKADWLSELYEELL